MTYKFYSFIIAGICLIAFILQLTVSGFTELFLLNQNSFIEPWRFVTSMFLHGDLVHFMYNMFALLLFGSILEKYIGSNKFLLVYFVTGLLASFGSVFFYDSALGASGAIFGIIGCLLIVRPSLTVFAFGLPMPLFVAGILWAIGDFIGIFMPSNVANIAHLLGMGAGIIFGSFMRNWDEEKDNASKVKFHEPSIRDWEDKYLVK